MSFQLVPYECAKMSYGGPVYHLGKKNDDGGGVITG